MHIDFIKYQDELSLKKEGGKTWIYDPVRKKHLILTPEELVRQLLLCHLLQVMNYPIGKIRVEKGLEINKRIKRCDILVYDKEFKPWLLVECKRAKVPIDQAVFDQIARYNMPLQVPYLMLSNGIDIYCCTMDVEAESYRFLDALPPYPSPE